MMQISKWLLLGTMLVFLFARGGEYDYARLALSFLVTVISFLLLPSLPRFIRNPDVGWIVSVFAPPIIIFILQVVPLGIPHPWAVEDYSLLGIPLRDARISLDPGATQISITWVITLVNISILINLMFRGGRVRDLAAAAVFIASIHALIAIMILLGGIDWPSEINSGYTHGSFVYTNHAAAFWASCIPLALLRARKSRGWRDWISVGTLSLALLLSGSRGGIIVAVIICAPIIYYILPRKRKLLWMGGIGIGTALWLSVIGLHDVGSKFQSMIGQTGLNLNGRLAIWKSILPLAMNSGPIGCGASTTKIAYFRSGDTSFSPLIVDHLHCDPLEWWLECGWLGGTASLLGFGFALYLILKRHKLSSDLDIDDEQRVFRMGALLGLLILILHSFIDFIFHSPAIVIESIIFLCIAAQCRRSPEVIIAKSSAISRIILGISAIFTFFSAVVSCRIEYDNVCAKNVGNYIYGRLSKNFPIDNSGLILHSINLTPHTPALACIQSWMYLNISSILGNRKDALAGSEIALNIAAKLAPSSAIAWADRATLACAEGRLSDASIAAQRAIAWAPSWPDIQLAILNLAVDKNRPSGISDESLRLIIRRLLSLNIQQPTWVFDLASRLLGPHELSQMLDGAPIRLQKSGYSWLMRNGELSDWITVSRNIADFPIATTAELSILMQQLYAKLPVQIIYPTTPSDRRQLAYLLAYCHLLIPKELKEALVLDGPPWSYFSEPIDILNYKTRHDIPKLFREELFHDWAQNITDRLLIACDILDSNNHKNFNRQTDPEILNALVSSVPPRIITDSERELCTLLLSKYRTAEWQRFSSHIEFSWLEIDGHEAHAFSTNEFWTGVVIDGNWIGWIRGSTDLAPLARGAGLHRLVLLHP
jgi:hypothetical protein